MNRAIRRTLERNAAKNFVPDLPLSLGPIPVCDDEYPETSPCPECGGSGIGTETYGGFGHYTRTDCDYCNGEGMLDNSIEAQNRRHRHYYGI